MYGCEFNRILTCYFIKVSFRASNFSRHFLMFIMAQLGVSD